MQIEFPKETEHYRTIYDGRNRDEWLELRRQGIGASDVPSIMGISRFGSPMSVYADKRSRIDSSIEMPEDQPSGVQNFGSFYEAKLIRDYRALSGRMAYRSTRLLQSKRWPWMFATIDGVQAEDGTPLGLIECKTDLYEWDGVPPDVDIQVQAQFAVTGFDWGTIALYWRASCQTDWKDVEPRQDMIEEIANVTQDFVGRIEQGVPPDPDYSDSCKRALFSLYPKQEAGKSIVPDEGDGAELLQVKERLQDLKKAIATLDIEKSELENKIKAYMKDAEQLTLPDGEGYTWKTIEYAESLRKAYSVRRLLYKGRPAPKKRPARKRRSR